MPAQGSAGNLFLKEQDLEIQVMKPSGGVSFVCIVISLAVSGCGGISIERHSGGQPAEGYVVYAPLLVVNVANTYVCKAPDKDGKCPDAAFVEKCVVGTPYYLPDYNTKYVVKFKDGLGSYSGQVTIKDGWMLAGATSTANPSAFITAAAAMEAATKSSKCKDGIYKLNLENGTFEPMHTPFFNQSR